MEVAVTLIDYIEAIDKAFKDAKTKRLNRFSDQWDGFSRDINRRFRATIQATDDDDARAVMAGAMVYWFNRSELLDLFSVARSRQKTTEIARLERRGKRLKKEILRGERTSGDGTVKEFVTLFQRTHIPG